MKVLKILNVEGADAENIDFVRKQVKVWQANVDDYEDDPQYKKWLVRLRKLEREENVRSKKIASAQKKMENTEKIKKLEQEISEKNKDEKKQKYQELILKDNIYFVRSQDRFYVWSDIKNTYSDININAFRTSYLLLDRREYNLFLEQLKESGRVVEDINYGYKHLPNYLNVISTKHWLKPNTSCTEINPWIDVLLDALGKGEREIKNHIEQLIWYKYLNPSDYKVPSLIVYGEGRLGKNECLVDGILATIFGEEQVATTGYGSLGGAFNSVVKGKTIVFIDEATAKKTDANVLKAMVGNQYLDLKEKYKNNMMVHNTPWYIAGGNDNTGVLLLDGTASDMRWSIIRVKARQNLMHWVSKRFGVDYDYDSLSGEAVTLFYKNDSIYTDKEAVRGFLGYLENKYGRDIKRPLPLRNEDYNDLVHSQKTVDTLFFDWLISNPKLEWLRGDEVFKLYALYVEENGSDFDKKSKKGKNRLIIELKLYIEDKAFQYGKITLERTSTTGLFKTDTDATTIRSHNGSSIGSYYREDNTALKDEFFELTTKIDDKITRINRLTDLQTIW